MARKDIITMSQKELKRHDVIHNVLGKAITQRKAADILDLSDRQIRRIVKRVREEGTKGLTHRSRGRRGHRAIPEDVKAKVLELYQGRYKGFGPTSATEKLFETDRISGKLETLFDPKKGRPNFPPLVMLKTLLLQQWHNLSDPEAEEAICDRLSFRKFLGLGLTDSVPDETTICRFRNNLVEYRLLDTLQIRFVMYYEEVFEEVNRQLEKKGLIIKQGSIVDATLVKSHYSAMNLKRC